MRRFLASALVAVALFCGGLFAVVHAQDTCIGCGVSGMYKASGAVATYTPGANVAVQFVNFASSTVSYSGVNGGTNFPSGSTVVLMFGQDQGTYTVSSVTIGGQSATAVTGAQDSSGLCNLYYAHMPAAETDSASITYSNRPGYAAVGGGYFSNLSSSTPTAGGNETFGNQADPQTLSATLTVPSSGFGFAGVWASATGAASSTALSWSNVTSSSGDTFSGFATHFDQLGTAHTATVGAGWNPSVSGVTLSMSFIACMSAGTWH